MPKPVRELPRCWELDLADAQAALQTRCSEKRGLALEGHVRGRRSASLELDGLAAAEGNDAKTMLKSLSN